MELMIEYYPERREVALWPQDPPFVDMVGDTHFVKGVKIGVTFYAEETDIIVGYDVYNVKDEAEAQEWRDKLSKNPHHLEQLAKG